MKLALNTKVATIAGGVIALALAVGGGTVAYNNHKDAEAKKAAEMAYARRPIVEHSCVMNGFGVGSCDFTNSGKTAGAVCGVVQVDGPGTAHSNKFCSGVVEPMTTEKVEFNIPAVDDLCDNGFESWTEKCSFDFIQEGSEA
jgi:hypothetical protein